MRVRGNGNREDGDRKKYEEIQSFSYLLWKDGLNGDCHTGKEKEKIKVGVKEGRRRPGCAWGWRGSDAGSLTPWNLEARRSPLGSPPGKTPRMSLPKNSPKKLMLSHRRWAGNSWSTPLGTGSDSRAAVERARTQCCFRGLSFVPRVVGIGKEGGGEKKEETKPSTCTRTRTPIHLISLFIIEREHVRRKPMKRRCMSM